MVKLGFLSLCLGDENCYFHHVFLITIPAFCDLYMIEYIRRLMEGLSLIDHRALLFASSIPFFFFVVVVVVVFAD